MKDSHDYADHLEGHTKKPLLKAIREKCLDCCIQQHSEVRQCNITDCSLWPYRMGKNPFRKHRLSKKQKTAAENRLKT